MKKLLSRVVGAWRGEARKPLCEQQWLAVALLGSGYFVVAGYLGLMLRDVIPELIEATNSAGMVWQIAGLWLLVAAIGACVWFFGCAAARCHTELYQRWFK